MNSARRVRVCVLLAVAHSVVASHATAATTPAVLNPPDTATLALAAHAEGAQLYACQATQDDPSHFTWALVAPEASLADSQGNRVGKHYAGPTWEANDGSTVVGDVVARDDGPDSAAIPWLLLRAKSTSGHGRFGAVTFVQRLHTVGGKAPATGCTADAAGRQLRVTYSADYNFYEPASTTAPFGLWKTFDDKTGAARALVRLYQHEGKLFGRIEQSFTPGADTRVCALCSDERKDQPIVGLVLIRNMKLDGNEYDAGDILDPDSGSVYRCRLHLEDDGARLMVRGYIGFSLLGRSQIWTRQP